MRANRLLTNDPNVLLQTEFCAPLSRRGKQSLDCILIHSNDLRLAVN